MIVLFWIMTICLSCSETPAPFGATDDIETDTSSETRRMHADADSDADSDADADSDSDTDTDTDTDNDDLETETQASDTDTGELEDLETETQASDTDLCSVKLCPPMTVVLSDIGSFFLECIACDDCSPNDCHGGYTTDTCETRVWVPVDPPAKTSAAMDAENCEYFPCCEVD